MIALCPSVLVFLLLVFLFCRETRIDCKRHLDEDRLGDEHILREVERFLKDKAIE
jgi:hypothetical protein